MGLKEDAKLWMERKNMSNITATEYQQKAAETAIFPKEKALEYLTLGLTGEAGEIANKVKKLIRDGADREGYHEKLNQIGYELGDVMWYCAMLAKEVDMNLGRIMEDNLDKLADRKARNRLQGDGDLNGNGPVDRQKRQVWLDAKWEPRTIKIGGVRVGYDQFEPFNLIMSTIADVGDASELMGEEWTENQLGKISLVIAQAVTSKSYLAGLQSFVDLFGGRPGQGPRIVAGLANNVVPLAGLRNEMGKLFTPYMREINSGIIQSIRNRNLLTEQIAGDDKLPIKYDMLNGKPLKDWDFLTRAFNAVSPVSLNLEQSPGRQLLFNSGYDLRLSTYYAPDGTKLTKNAEVRSLFQQAIGLQNLERELDKLAKDPKIKASIQQMYDDIKSGRRGDFDVRDYYHNQIIEQIFSTARRKAWASISNKQAVQKLILETRAGKVEQLQKRVNTANILNIYK